MFGNPLLLADEGYQISRSVRLRSSASAYFNRTAGTPTNANIWTWSGWVKRGTLTTRGVLLGGGSTNLNYIAFSDSASTDYFGLTYTNSPAQLVNVMTTQVFRDTSAWYHLMVVYDSTSATSTITGSATDRVRLYVNGVQVTAFSATSGPSQNTSVNINAASAALNLGRRNLPSPDSYFDGYLTEINFIDGQALTPSNFGTTDAITGVWKPKKYIGTYGTNGFYLNFSDNSSNTATTIGKDYSGNGNNWTPNNISVTAGSTYDSMLDVPTLWADGGNGRGNYCVMNPLKLQANMRLTNGNLDVSSVDAGSAYGAFSSIVMDSGKWYAEFLVNTSTGAYPNIGIGDLSKNPNTNEGFYGTKGVSYNRDGTVYRDGSLLGTFSTFTNGDVISVAFDPANSRVYFAKNNTWINSGDPANGTGFFTVNAAVQGYVFGGAVYQPASFSCNFGQRTFSYTPPTGFKALNTQNLPEPTIKKGNAYFDATTYTGNNSTNVITNSGSMQPDLVWIKSRSSAFDHALIDAQRGVTKWLASNSTAAEATSGAGQDLVSFNSNGFTLGPANTAYVNNNSLTFVGWQWKEGATQGFDIVTYTGTGVARTVAHTLGVAPSMMIVKSRGAVQAWVVYHSSLGTGKVMVLNGTNAVQSLANYWDTAPTSSVINLGSNSDVNGNGTTFVGYLFAEVAGFSRFGSYTGNGSADGPFVFLGFRPRWIMWKRTDAISDWEIVDAARPDRNVVTGVLYANLSNAEVTSSGECDFTANGFKIRDNSNRLNASGGTYIYAAFAESPFKLALAR